MIEFLQKRIRENKDRVSYFKDCLEVVYDLDRCNNYKMEYLGLEFYVYKRKRRLIASTMYANFMNLVFKDEWVQVASSVDRNPIP